MRGLNCGQKGWPAGFDYFPCQRDEFVMADDGSWIDHIAYCGGKNNTCQTPIVFTVANVSLTSPGVMTHWYVLLVVNCNPIFLLSFAEIRHRHRKQIESWRADSLQ